MWLIYIKPHNINFVVAYDKSVANVLLVLITIKQMRHIFKSSLN